MGACKLTSVEEIPKRETGSPQGTGEGKRKDEYRSRRFGQSPRVPYKPEVQRRSGREDDICSRMISYFRGCAGGKTDRVD